MRNKKLAAVSILAIIWAILSMSSALAFTVAKEVEVWADDCAVVHIKETGSPQMAGLIQFFPPDSFFTSFNVGVDPFYSTYQLCKECLGYDQIDFNFMITAPQDIVQHWLFVHDTYVTVGDNVIIANDGPEMANGGARFRYVGPIPPKDSCP